MCYTDRPCSSSAGVNFYRAQISYFWRLWGAQGFDVNESWCGWHLSAPWLTCFAWRWQIPHSCLSPAQSPCHYRAALLAWIMESAWKTFPECLRWIRISPARRCTAVRDLKDPLKPISHLFLNSLQGQRKPISFKFNAAQRLYKWLQQFTATRQIIFLLTSSVLTRHNASSDKSFQLNLSFCLKHQPCFIMCSAWLLLWSKILLYMTNY